MFLFIESHPVASIFRPLLGFELFAFRIAHRVVDGISVDERMPRLALGYGHFAEVAIGVSFQSERLSRVGSQEHLSAVVCGLERGGNDELQVAVGHDVEHGYGRGCHDAHRVVPRTDAVVVLGVDGQGFSFQGKGCAEFAGIHVSEDGSQFAFSVSSSKHTFPILFLEDEPSAAEGQDEVHDALGIPFRPFTLVGHFEQELDGLDVSGRNGQRAALVSAVAMEFRLVAVGVVGHFLG